MKLFTKEIDNKLFAQYSKGSDLSNQMVVAKIFNPYGRGTWYLINSDEDDPDYLWAIVDLFEVEVGSVSRKELESIKIKPFNFGLERDLSFRPRNAEEVFKGLLSGKTYAKGGKLKYEPSRDVVAIAIKDGPLSMMFTKGDFLGGAYQMEKGGSLENYLYVSPRKIIFARLKSGEDIKPINGFYIRKDASGTVITGAASKPLKKANVKSLKISIPRPILLTGSPSKSPKMMKFIGTFSGKDPIRPAMSFVQVKEGSIVATDANKLIRIIDGSTLNEDKLVCESRVCKDNNPEDQKFPNWTPIVNSFDGQFSESYDMVDLYEALMQVRNDDLKNKVSKTLRVIELKLENVTIYFNITLLLQCVKGCLLLGWKKAFISYSSAEYKAVVFTEETVQGRLSSVSLIMLMPIFGSDDFEKVTITPKVLLEQGGMMADGGEVVIPTTNLNYNPDYLVGTNTMYEMFADGGMMAQSGNQPEIRWDSVENAIINFLKANTKILDKRVQAKDTEGTINGLNSIIDGLTNAQKNLNLNFISTSSSKMQYGGMMAKGGAIENQYEGRTPKDIWNNLTEDQKYHFVNDHELQIEMLKDENYDYNSDKFPKEISTDFVSKSMRSEWKDLDEVVQNRFANHVRQGEYADGGMMAKGGSILEDISECKKLVSAFCKEFGEKFGLDEEKVLKEVKFQDYLGYGASVFIYLSITSNVTDLKVGETKPRNGYIKISSGINPNGITGKDDIARTYVIDIELKGDKRYTQRKTEEGRYFKSYQYGRTIDDVMDATDTKIIYDLSPLEKKDDLKFKMSGVMAKGGITYKNLSLEKPSLVNETKIQSERFKINEIDLFRKSQNTFSGSPIIRSSADSVKIFREFWDEQSLTIFESFNVMLLNQANKVIGLYQHSKGGVTGTVADPEMVVLSAVKSLAKGVIISHNHPSGNLRPSQADIEMTNKIKNALKFVDVLLLDSIIITENSYYSFADEGIMALGGMTADGGMMSKGGALEHMILLGDKVLDIYKNVLIVESAYGGVTVLDFRQEPIARRILVERITGKNTLASAKEFIDADPSFKTQSMAVGGSLQGHGFEVGDRIAEDLGGYIRVVSEDGKDYFIKLRDGDRLTEPPLPFKHGGKVKHSDVTRLATKTNEAGDEVVDLTEFYEGGGNVPKVFDVPAQFLDAEGKRKNDRKTIKELTDFVLALPQTKEIYYNDELGDYTPSRKKLHAEIINKFKKEVVCINNDQPIAIFMGGSPASGKSSFLRKYSPFLLKEEILKIDADEIRAMLPEYEGWNATQTHLETKDIVNILLSNKNIGIPCDFDIIYDGTMNSVKSYIPLMDILRKRGYKIFIVFMDNVPKDVIIKRALDRYKTSGRFVPLEVIEDFFSKGKTAFNELKKDVDGYMLIDGSSRDYNVIEEGGIKLPRDREYSKLGTKIKASDIPVSYKKGGLSLLY